MHTVRSSLPSLSLSHSLTRFDVVAAVIIAIIIIILTIYTNIVLCGRSVYVYFGNVAFMRLAIYFVACFFSSFYVHKWASGVRLMLFCRTIYYYYTTTTTIKIGEKKSKTHWFIINVLYLRRAPSVLFSRVIQTRIYVLDGELTHSGLCFFLFCAHGCMISLSVLHQYFVGLVSTKLHSNFLASDIFFCCFPTRKKKTHIEA